MRRLLPATTLAIGLLTLLPAPPATASTPDAPPSLSASLLTAPASTAGDPPPQAGPLLSPTVSTADDPPTLAVPSDLRATEVSFTGAGGLAMHGTVLSPVGAKTALPGMVLVHGAGATLRTKLMGEAIAFAHQGLSVLVYDKRTLGYSLFHRSYSQLADDAIGGIAALRAQPGVDPAKVGIWGLSEGGWVAPMAAARSKDIAFLVTVGANAMQPLRQQTWAVAAGLRKAGVSGSLIDHAELNLYRTIADGGMFPEPYYDARPTIAAVRQPVLGIWGVDDLLTPPVENPPMFAKALQQGGNEHYTFRYFAGADHAAHRTPDRGVTRLPELIPGYADLVGSWVKDVTSGKYPTVRVSGPPPVQVSPSVPVDPPAWWASAWAQLAALVLFAAGFIGYPLTALVRRLRGRGRAPVSRAARLLSATGLTAVLGSFCYMFYLVMTGGKLAAPGPVLAGRPLIWLALQAVAVVAVLATARTALSWHRTPSPVPPTERTRFTLLLTAGTLFIPWSLYWGLLLP
ncbi:alpha/beta hydrolase family protein [Sphaerisporangium corydalis]|uniref:Alpha/beta hydrolase family protein n=1 Tax=Sphaerisporangium corydalis TaxID=1441875 RepID=A0ABV9EH81_9ACTN|nr:prolyl oligopeptidase family serine peptidase [Sphaerisporangium corydalis]